MLLDQSRANGNLGRYFAKLRVACGQDNVEMAKAIGTTGPHKLPAFGIPIAAEFLKNIGYDCAKPDRHINRAAGSFGLCEFANWRDRQGTKAPMATGRELVDVMYAVRDMACSLHLTPTFVDNCIWLLCAKGGLHYGNEALEELRPRLDRPL
jgi:hypothetical protein